MSTVVMFWPVKRNAPDYWWFHSTRSPFVENEAMAYAHGFSDQYPDYERWCRVLITGLATQHHSDAYITDHFVEVVRDLLTEESWKTAYDNPKWHEMTLRGCGFEWGNLPSDFKVYDPQLAQDIIDWLLRWKDHFVLIDLVE